MCETSPPFNTKSAVIYPNHFYKYYILTIENLSEFRLTEQLSLGP